MKRNTIIKVTKDICCCCQTVCMNTVSFSYA